MKDNYPFTEEQMKQIYGTNLIDFAVSRGFQLDPAYRDKYTVHIKGYGGLYLFKHGRGYICFSGGKGNIVDFAMEFLGFTKRQAMEEILGCKAYENQKHIIPPMEKEKRGKLEIPPKDNNNRKVFAYLTRTRKLEPEIVNAMIKKGRIYQTRQQVRDKVINNCAFMGYDTNGQVKYCALRGCSAGSSYRLDLPDSDKSFGFIMEGRSSRVYEFEAPIDAMSHASFFYMMGMDWEMDHRVSEGCLSNKALERYLSFHPEIDEIVFCYDNDMEGKLPDGTPHNHGQIKARKECDYYRARGYKTWIQTPCEKDYNAMLTTDNLYQSITHFLSFYGEKVKEQETEGESEYEDEWEYY